VGDGEGVGVGVGVGVGTGLGVGVGVGVGLGVVIGVGLGDVGVGEMSVVTAGLTGPMVTIVPGSSIGPAPFDGVLGVEGVPDVECGTALT